MGRKAKEYRPEFVGFAYKFAVLGADDKKLAFGFDISERTLNRWKKLHPDFLAALKRGKDEVDANVAVSLLRRALGYEHEAVKIHVLKDGTIIQVPYTQRYPPDTVAAMCWLQNRQPELWRDRRAEMDRPVTGEPTEIAKGIRSALRLAAAADGLEEIDAPAANDVNTPSDRAE